VLVAKKPPSPVTLDAQTRIAVLIGDDAFMAGEYTNMLREALVHAHGADGFDAIRFDGASAKIGDVLDECRTFGLMQQHKLVIVDNAEQMIKEDARPIMERYADEPASGATLVLRCSRWYKGKLDDKIAAVGCIVEMGELGADQAINWTIKRAQKRHNATIERPAADLLVQKIGVELGRLDTELEKLATFAGGSRDPQASPSLITLAMVGEMVGLTREEEAWGLQATILEGNASAALSHLRVILDNSRKDAAVPLSWACMDLARKLHAASWALKQGENPWQLAGKLKLWGPGKDAVLAAAKKANPTHVARLLNAAIEADRRSKSGLGTFDRNLERLTLRLTQSLRD
jgi:DNA polymerase-3 subunit delta